MNTMLSPSKRPSIAHLLLYGLALSLVLLAPVLGMLAAAVLVWQALLAGSIWYMPLGLMLVLMAIALVQSHKPFDLSLLVLVVVAVIASSRVGSLQLVSWVEAMQAWVPRNDYFLGGLLLVLIVALVLIHTARRDGRW